MLVKKFFSLHLQGIFMGMEWKNVCILEYPGVSQILNGKTDLI